MELYIWIAVLLSAFFVLTIIWHAIQMKKRHKSAAFMAVDLIFVMLILLGMLIVNRTSFGYENMLGCAKEYTYQKSDNMEANHNHSDQSKSESDLVSNLISMQANTLSVTVTIVTISCIIISILTIYREKKAETNNQKVEDSLKKLEKTESIIQEIAAISSALLLNDNQKDFFISIFKNEVEHMSLNKEPQDIATAHFQMIVLNIILNDQYYMPKNVEETNKYDMIIRSANKIIESEDATHLSVSLAYVERAHAAYQKLKTSTDTKDVKQIKKNMKYASDYVRYLKYFNDNSGNVLNLEGLIELWTGIAKTRINEITENGNRYTSDDCLEHYTTALKYFEDAIEMNKRKKEFKNHRIVAQLRISDVCNHSQKIKNIDCVMDLCKTLIQEVPNYIKPYINYADAIARKIRIKLNPKLIWNEDTKRQIYDYSQLQPEHGLSQNEITDLRKKALGALEKAIEIDSGFANGYYKRTEINLLWLGYNLWLLYSGKVCATLGKMLEICDNCENDLLHATVCIGTTTKIVGYEKSLEIIHQKLKNTKKISNAKKKSTIGKKASN